MKSPASPLAAPYLLFLLVAVGLNGRSPAAPTEGTGDTTDVQIEDLAWIAGAWRGSAFGGECEEVWRPPMAGAMLGMFRLVRDGKPSFYELMLIAREEGRLVLKVKHFSAELHAWEDKEDAVVFPLLRAEPGQLIFEGLTMTRNGETGLDIKVQMKRGEQISEELLSLTRTG